MKKINNKEYFDFLTKGIKENEHICVQLINSNGKALKPKCFTNFEEYNKYVEENKSSSNVYIGIATTDGGESRNAAHLISSNMIVLDFDFKDEDGNYLPKPPLDDIINKIRSKMKLFINAVVDSGHGYHLYIEIERTYDIDRWNNCTKKLVEIFGADPRAALSTQIIRIPATYNVKDGIENKLFVTPITPITPRPNKPYSLDDIELLIDTFINAQTAENLKNQIKPCVKKMGEKGVAVGERNLALGRVVSELKRLGYSDSKVIKAALNFNSHCTSPKDYDEVMQEINGYLKNPHYFGCAMNSSKDLTSQFCVGAENCPFAKKSEKHVFRLPYSKKVQIPFEAFSHELNLSGGEMATLVYISDKSDIPSNKVAAKTINNYVQLLKDKKLITMSEGWYKVQNPSGIKINVPFSFAKGFFEKKYSAVEVKILCALCVYTKIEIMPSMEQISSFLKSDKSYISKNIKALEDKNIIFSEDIYYGINKTKKLHF